MYADQGTNHSKVVLSAKLSGGRSRRGHTGPVTPTSVKVKLDAREKAYLYTLRCSVFPPTSAAPVQPYTQNRRDQCLPPVQDEARRYSFGLGVHCAALPARQPSRRRVRLRTYEWIMLICLEPYWAQRWEVRRLTGSDYCGSFGNSTAVLCFCTFGACESTVVSRDEEAYICRGAGGVDNDRTEVRSS